MNEINNYEVHLNEAIEPISLGNIAEVKVEDGAYLFYTPENVLNFSAPLKSVYYIKIK